LDDTITVDLGLRYKARKTPWNIAIGVRNLFDEDMRSPSLGPNANGVINIPDDYPEAGRSYFGEVRYQFK
jgi:iron complex outermembrane receptor protein